MNEEKELKEQTPTKEIKKENLNILYNIILRYKLFCVLLKNKDKNKIVSKYLKRSGYCIFITISWLVTFLFLLFIGIVLRLFGVGTIFKTLFFSLIISFFIELLYFACLKFLINKSDEIIDNINILYRTTKQTINMNRYTMKEKFESV